MASRLRDMGQMAITDGGVLQWTLRTGDVVALQQFRDNLMVAAKGPEPHTTMYTVCKTMEGILDLRVPCPAVIKIPT